MTILVNKKMGRGRQLNGPSGKTDSEKGRVKQFSVSFSNRSKLVVSLRRFRTSKTRRSKKIRQIVFQPKVFGIREIAVSYQKRRPRYYKVITIGTKDNHISFQRRLVTPLAFIALGIIGSIFFGINISRPVNLNLSHRVSAAPIDATPSFMTRSEPVKLIIPKIGVDTSLESIDKQPDGTIGTPSQFEDAGWYIRGPTPGEIGPAVIVGHVDSYQGIAVFWRLRELIPGNEVKVKRQDGSVANFKVTDIKQYPQENFPTQEVYGNLNYAGLRLITCGGTFNTQTQHYSDNTVVFASLIK